MKVFLSGKIDRKLGDWRTELVGNRWNYESHEFVPNWVILKPGALAEGSFEWPIPVEPWGTEPNRHVLGLHEYVGPYRTEYEKPSEGKYQGEFHGSEVGGDHGCPTKAARRTINTECLAAIRRADFIFAYINSPDCYGTLTEIGYARALGKYIHLVIEDLVEWEWTDYWFARELANAVSGTGDSFGEQVTIKEIFQHAIVEWSGHVEMQRNNLVSIPSEVLRAFGSIEKWTSDPRVRAEARRMLQSLG